MKGDCTPGKFVHPSGGEGDHPQMKGDCTGAVRDLGRVEEGDHPQMKGDCTQRAVRKVTSS